MLKTKRLSFLFLIPALLVTAGLYGQDLKATLPIDPALKVGKLSNGLTYYIKKNSKPEKKVELRLAINAGSIQEDDDQQGLAHFTEHMAFNGTKNFKKNEVVSFLQSIGVEFGADLNAYTSFDETVYILPIPLDKPENLLKGMQILSDWASTVAFETAEIEKERGVVLEESRLGKGAEDRMQKVIYPKIFTGSKYANRLPIGQDQILKTFKPDVIKRFYKEWYRPDNMAIAVVGDINPDEIEALIKKNFEKLKNPSKARPRTLVPVPPRTKSEGVVVTDKEATNSVLEIYFPFKPAKKELLVEDYRQSMVQQLFQSMLGQRIQELTQRANPPFIFAGTFVGDFIRGVEGVQSIAYLTKNGVEPAITALIQENERARRYGFTEAELDRTKKNLMKGMERSFNERDKTESSTLVEECLRNFLTQEPIPGIAKEYEYFNLYLNGITLAEVNTFAATHLPQPGEHKLVALSGPEKTEFTLPTADELVAMIDKAGSGDIKAYTEKAVSTTLIATPPVAGKITAEKALTEIGATELILSNGIRVIVKSTDFKNDQVVMSATRWGGQHQYDASDRVNIENASIVVSQMGIGNFSPVDLRKALAGKNANVSPRIGTLSDGISGQSSATDIETMLQLTHLYFTNPRLDEELFKSFISKQKDLLQNMSSDPQFIFQDSVTSVLYKKHPWAPRNPKPEYYSAIDLNKAYGFFKEKFSDAGGFTFIFVGAIDLNKFKPLLELYLGSLATTNKARAYKDAGVKALSGNKVTEVKKGTEKKSYIQLFWNGTATYSESEALKVQALTEIMNIVLIESLREDLGGIYGGGMFGGLNPLPTGTYSIAVSLPCGPENVQKLITATFAEVEKIKTTGPKESDLEKVKETWRQQYDVNIKDNNFWLRNIQRSVEYKTNFAEILKYKEKIAVLTVKDVQDVAKKYLDSKNCLQFILNPE